MRPLVLTLLLFATFLSGCIETKDEFILNPDGSGKVIHQAIFQPIELTDAEKQRGIVMQMKEAVLKELQNSTGVEVWKDVTYKRSQDGRVQFQGTAYFRDLSKLRIYNNTFMSVLFVPTQTNESGALVLLLGSTNLVRNTAMAKTAPTPLSESEIKTKIEDAKVKYQQTRPMLVAFFTSLKEECSFRLPGKVAEGTNLKRSTNGTLMFQFDGAKLMEIYDNEAKDDAHWRKQVLGGDNLSKDDPENALQMNEKLFGEKAPVRAVMRGPFNPLFDYEKEVAQAKQTFPAMVKALDLGATATMVLALPVRGVGFKTLRVSGMRLENSKHDAQWILSQENPGIMLTLIGEFPSAVVSITQGKVEKAIADNGDDLLPPDDWRRQLKFHPVYTNKAMAEFEVHLMHPNNGAHGIREIGGTVQYVAMTTTKQVDLGFTDLATGSRGKVYGATIQDVHDSLYAKGKTTLQLRLNLPKDQIKSIQVYDSNGTKYDSNGDASMWTENTTTLDYIVEGILPHKGKVILELLEQPQKLEAPFAITNIPLLGQALK